MDRRRFLGGALAAPLLGTGLAAFAAETALPILKVAKSRTCGCCGAWVEHMREAGFEVEVHEVADDDLAALKRHVGLAPEQMSCHTAEIDGYVVEGHVPAEDVRRLLTERPEARGLTVPGMPVGSPGMEMGDRRDAFDTLLVLPDGSDAVFASH